jgi:hypothetical protein
LTRRRTLPAGRGCATSLLEDGVHSRRESIAEARSTRPSETSPPTSHRPPRASYGLASGSCSGSTRSRSGSPRLGSPVATMQKRGRVVEVAVGARIQAVPSAPAPLCASSIKASAHAHRRPRGVAFGDGPPLSYPGVSGQSPTAIRCSRCERCRSAVIRRQLLRSALKLDSSRGLWCFVAVEA